MQNLIINNLLIFLVIIRLFGMVLSLLLYKYFSLFCFVFYVFIPRKFVIHVKHCR